MFNIDNYHNIRLLTDDNGIIDFQLCGETLTNGDVVTFSCEEQEFTTSEFTDGVAKIYIKDKKEPFEGCYKIMVKMKDGRQSTVIKGKFSRRGC